MSTFWNYSDRRLIRVVNFKFKKLIICIPIKTQILIYDAFNSSAENNHRLIIRDGIGKRKWNLPTPCHQSMRNYIKGSISVDLAQFNWLNSWRFLEPTKRGSSGQNRDRNNLPETL
ncbi:hypothetical protein D2E72_06680 [Mycobacteroides abscessus]|nr:hypothetical protein D2E72_06680 [Mycobacteroides abscessus]